MKTCIFITEYIHISPALTNVKTEEGERRDEEKNLKKQQVSYVAVSVHKFLSLLPEVSSLFFFFVFFLCSGEVYYIGILIIDY